MHSTAALRTHVRLGRPPPRKLGRQTTSERIGAAGRSTRAELESRAPAPRSRAQKPIRYRKPPRRSRRRLGLQNEVLRGAGHVPTGSRSQLSSRMCARKHAKTPSKTAACPALHPSSRAPLREAAHTPAESLRASGGIPKLRKGLMSCPRGRRNRASGRKSGRQRRKNSGHKPIPSNDLHLQPAQPSRKNARALTTDFPRLFSPSRNDERSSARRGGNGRRNGPDGGSLRGCRRLFENKGDP